MRCLATWVRVCLFGMAEGLYGDGTLTSLVGAEEAAALAEKGRGSEIGFIAIKRARA